VQTGRQSWKEDKEDKEAL